MHRESTMPTSPSEHEWAHTPSLPWCSRCKFWLITFRKVVQQHG